MANIRASRSSSVSDEPDGGSFAGFTSYSMDTDHPSYRAAENSSNDCCRWYGNIFFDCLIAEIVFRGAEKFANGTSIDSDLKVALRNYPIEECLTKIMGDKDIHFPFNMERMQGDQYSKLMTVIGVTILRGDNRTKRSLAEIIQACITKSSPGLAQWETMPPSPPDSVDESDDEPVRPSQPRRAVRSEAALHTYTSKLYEWAKQHRVELRWDAKMISDYNDWEHSVSFEGKEFRAEAQLKQDAKHKAAKKACEYLRL